MAAVPVWAQSDLIGPIYAEGVRHYNTRNWIAAIDYFGQVCDMVPDHQQARYYLATALAQTGQADKALQQAMFLNQRWPNVPQYVELLKQCQKVYPFGKVTGTEKLTPPTPEPQSGTRSPVGQRNRYGVVKESVIEGSSPTEWVPNLPGRPNKPRVSSHTPLDDALDALDAQQYATATAKLDALIKKDPKDARPVHFRGVVEYQQGNYDEALKFFAAALKLDGKNVDTMYLQGDTYLKTNKLAEAEKSFKDALAVKEDAFTYVSLAEVKKAQGKYADAQEIYEKVMKLDPNNTEARIAFADAQVEVGKIELAAKTVNEVLEKEADNASAHYVKGKILLAGGLPEDAAQELQRAILLAPKEKIFKVVLARCFIASGRVDQALMQTQDLLHEDENDYDARLITAEGLILTEALPDAQEHLDKAEKIRASSRLTLLKARLAGKQKKNDEARALFTQVLDADKHNGEAKICYAEFLESIGSAEPAKKYFREVVDEFPGTQWATRAESRIAGLSGATGDAGGTPAPTPAPTPTPTPETGSGAGSGPVNPY